MTRADLSGIDAITGLDGVTLPQNYARRALGVFQGQIGDDTYVPWIKLSNSDKIPKFDASILTKPAKLKRQFDTDETSWLGAFTPVSDSQLAPNVDRTSQAATGAKKALGIIDVGFAFWNDRFLAGGNSVFSDIGFLSSNGEDQTWLTHPGIADLLRDTDPTYRNQVIRSALAEKFPQSIYAATERGLSVYTSSGFNHGTAMADLALPDELLPTYALELPADALLDSSGDLLEANLIPAIRVLLNRMIADPTVTDDTEKVILLAFGYPGGPHDATRPIIQALKAELATSNIVLVVPVGNHLQERCHARWDINGNEATEPLPWVFPVEDYSPNHVSLHYDDARPDISLTDPLGNTVTWAKTDARLVKLMGRADGRDVVLGLALDTPEAAGGKVDVILAPTAGDFDHCRAGRWALQVAGGSQKVDAWISRDDMSIPGAVARQRKQSWFDDDHYHIYGDYGRYAQSDQPDARIKRAGTASALTTFDAAEKGVVVVGAGQETFDGMINAEYSGLPYDGTPPSLENVHPEIGSSGVLALGNGGVTKFRVSGSSAAAAMRAKAILSAVAVS